MSPCSRQKASTPFLSLKSCKGLLVSLQNILSSNARKVGSRFDATVLTSGARSKANNNSKHGTDKAFNGATRILAATKLISVLFLATVTMFTIAPYTLDDASQIHREVAVI